jgi:3-hydroxy-9,10-secoandrosta-1,3,5(10)-triene-9,17-dione monooxygenase
MALAPPISPPEPDLTPAEVVARADAMRERLVERQAETEKLLYYSQQTHEELLEAGLYRILVPRRFGGYEFDLPTFWRVVIALGRGCPSAAWCFCLAAGHALQVGSLWEEEAQAELFGDGHFLAAAVAAPAGEATRTADGWELNSTHTYASGSPYSTHFVGQTFIREEGEGPPRILLFAAPRSEWTMLDDWGDTLGMKGSGSHSVRLEGGRIPARFGLEDTWLVDVDAERGTPGSRLHPNPMYAGRTLSFFQGELSAIMIGAVKGALDEYEEIIHTRKTQRPPIVPRFQDPDYQRWLGVAIGKVAAAEAALLQVGTQYMELCRRAVEDGIPFTREDDLRLNVVGREAMTLAWEAMQGTVLRTAGSPRNGQRMERIFRDMTMGWSHFSNVAADWSARELARAHLGLVAEGAPRPDRQHNV